VLSPLLSLEHVFCLTFLHSYILTTRRSELPVLTEAGRVLILREPRPTRGPISFLFLFLYYTYTYTIHIHILYIYIYYTYTYTIHIHILYIYIYYTYTYTIRIHIGVRADTGIELRLPVRM